MTEIEILLTTVKILVSEIENLCVIAVHSYISEGQSSRVCLPVNTNAVIIKGAIVKIKLYTALLVILSFRSPYIDTA